MTQPGVAGMGAGTVIATRTGQRAVTVRCHHRSFSRPLSRSTPRSQRPTPKAISHNGQGICSRPRTSGCSKAPIAIRGRSRIRSWTRLESRTARRSRTSAPAPAGSRSCLARRRWTERDGLRGGRPAADARSDSQARQPRRAAERPGAPRHQHRSTPAGHARSTRSSSSTCIPEVDVDDRVTFLRNLARALKPNGRIGIVNYKPGQGGPGPSPTEGVRVEITAVEADARAAGLRVLARENLPFQHLLVLGR